MIDEIKALGLSEVESKVYIALSKLGLETAYKVAKEANLYKSNTYDAIAKLIERNLVEKKIIDGKTLYEARDPKYLLDLLEKKKDNLLTIVPTIRLMQSSNTKDSSFNVFHGGEAVLSILTSWLDFGEPILVFGVPKDAAKKIGPKINLYHKKRIEKKIIMYHIYNYDTTERIPVLKEMPLTYLRRLPKNFDSVAATNICGNEIMFTLWEPEVKIFLIKDVDLASAYKNYFQLLWNQSTEYD